MRWRNCLTAGILAAAGFMTMSFTQTANAAEQIPNPIVEYATVGEAAKTAGFTPLYLPKIAGYHVDYVSVIDKDTIDLGYVRDGEPATTLRVRTSKTSAVSHLSGISGTKWTQNKIAGLKVAVAELPAAAATDPKGYAAEWQQNSYRFSVTARAISASEFQNLLTDGLVDLSEHYFR